MILRRSVLLALLVTLSSGCNAGNPAVGLNHPAPDFTATDLADNRTISFHSDYRGQVTLVNIWATWCGPCRQEIPTLEQLYQEFGPQGLRIAAISIDTDSASAVRDFMNQMGVTFDVLHDPANRIQTTYHSEKVPESFLIDRHGRIVRIDYGARDWSTVDMKRLVAALLADSVRSP